MTVGLGWITQNSAEKQYLYLASDSRLTGARTDTAPKILTLPRSDCALCFAGDTHATYPMMLQIANALGAHEPARDRSLDIARVKDHLLRILEDLVSHYECPFAKTGIQFIFGGYSWMSKKFRLWDIRYSPHTRRFSGREALTFRPNLPNATFIGDGAKRVRREVVAKLMEMKTPVNLEPLQVLASALDRCAKHDSIGGAPQVVRISQHMTTRPFCVQWKGKDTLFGRPLFDYENIDYLRIDPLTGIMSGTRNYGQR